jgi:hypothetical protein
MSFREQGITIVNILKQYGYESVAVYGAGVLGRHLLGELEDNDIQVSYIIDRRDVAEYQRWSVKHIEDDLEPVDAVIVTAIDDFEEIYDGLVQKVDCPIWSFAELIQEASIKNT